MKNKMQSAVGRSQESGGRSKEAGGRSKESGVRRQEAGVRRQEAGVTSQELRSQDSEYRRWVIHRLRRFHRFGKAIREIGLICGALPSVSVDRQRSVLFVLFVDPLLVLADDSRENHELRE